MKKFSFAFLLLFNVFLFSNNFEEQKTLTLTIPETDLIIKDIPTHNKNEAIAHVRSQLNQIFSHLKQTYIDQALSNYEEYLNQQESQPYFNQSTIVFECQVAYDRHGEIIGCTEPPLDCTCVIVIGKKTFNSDGLTR